MQSRGITIETAAHDHSLQVETEMQKNHLRQHSTSKIEPYAIQEEQKEIHNSTLKFLEHYPQNIQLYECHQVD